jgi:hypothetical protein
MATEKQIAANRRNAQKSTGPNTIEGKQRSRANATTHGLTAATTIYRALRHEDPAEFAELRGRLITDWNPVGTQELLAVEMMASAYKRIQRAEACEAAYLDGAMQSIQMRHDKPLTPTDHDDLGCGIAFGAKEHKLTWETLDRYRRGAWLDYNRTLEQMRRLQKDRANQDQREAREIRAHNARQTYLKNTHVGVQRAIPVDQMGSFGPRHPARTKLRLEPRSGTRPSNQPTS